MMPYLTGLLKLGSLGPIATSILYGSLVLAGVMIVIFLLGHKHDLKEKFLGILVLLFGLGVFFAFFKGGLMLGARIGIGEFGALIGAVGFWLLCSIVAYFQRPRHLRRRRRFF